MITVSGFRLLLGLTPEGRQKRVNFLELEWSYEAAVIAKGYECFLEAGLHPSWFVIGCDANGRLTAEEAEPGDVSLDSCLAAGRGARDTDCL